MSLRHISRIGLRAVQGLKEQSCRGTLKPSQGRPRSEADNPNQIRWVSGTVEPIVKVDGNKMLSPREVEKAENLVHLICWGPR